MKFIRLFLIPVFLLTAAGNALAGVAEKVASDLQPATGVLIQPAEGEYLIDLDASKGLRRGDLVAVVKPGDKIIHPVTGATLGSLDRVKGILQVTRVREGFSFARPLGSEGNFERGDVVRRFANIPAGFWDYTGAGEAVYSDLREALPALDWQGYAEGQKQKPASPARLLGAPPLLFVLNEGSLDVRGPDYGLISSYPLAKTPAAAAAPAGTGAIVPGAPTVSTAIVSKKGSEVEGLSFPAEFEGVLAGIAVADLDGDGRQEVVAAFPYRLEIGRVVNGTFERLQEIDLGYGRKVVAVDAADLEKDGRSELFVTAADSGDLRSFQVAYAEGRYKVVRENIPWYFRSIPLPGEGHVLMAQRIGGLEDDFYGPIFRVILEGGSLAEGPEVPAPQSVELFGFVPFRAEGQKPLFAELNSWDRLKVVRPDGEVLWESEDRFGGSEEYLERIDPKKNPSSGPSTRNAFLQQRMEIGPRGELLVPVNEGSRLLSQVRSYKSSQIKAMGWTGFALQELWHTQPQQGYLADFRLADVDNDGAKELVQGLVFARKGFMRKGRSALAVIEIP